jgi:hypothetical protein
LSHGIGRPKERERDVGMPVGGAVRTHKHLSIKFAVLYGRSLWHPKAITVVTSQITVTDIIMIMKRF